MRSRSGNCEIFVGDDNYNACLRIGELRGLQEKLGVGPSILAARFTTGDWMVDDVIETVRFALIGGGMAHKEAKRLVDSYIVDGHLQEYVSAAQEAVLTALLGVEDEELPEEEEEVEEDEEGKPQTQAV